MKPDFDPPSRSPFPPRLSVALLLGAVCGLATSCGGTSSDAQEGPVASQDLVVTTGALVDGALWQLNRSIEITADRPLDFSSLSASNVAVVSTSSGAPVVGDWRPGLDPITGEVDFARICFQPACPVAPDDLPGFQPGANYALRVQGRESAAFILRGADGSSLETTLTIEFTTPSGTDPATLFFDSSPGAPAPVFRDQLGVAPDEAETTRIEVGRYQPQTAMLGVDPFGIVRVDWDPFGAVTGGLPLNHYVSPDSTVAFVVEFDEAIGLAEENAARLGLDYFDGTWHRVPTRGDRLTSCGQRGSSVRLMPLGTLPPGAPLRLRMDADFTDLVGHSAGAPRYVYLPVEGTEAAGPRGARVDALFEHFTVGGDEPGSMEDTTSDLGAARGFWGSGLISGVETPDGVSRVRSKWVPIGLAGVDGMGDPVRPDFSFRGVDENGVVQASAGSITLEPPLIGPVQPSLMGVSSAQLFLADLLEPTGLYDAQPGLLAGDRLQLRSSMAELESQIFTSEALPTSVRLGVGSGCYAPGFSLDCVPWNLQVLFPDLSDARAEIIPQSFEVYTWINRDLILPDHRVTITFDAAQAGADGRVDESSSYALANGWATDVAELSAGPAAGAPYAFLRFQVQFELDVSGDGYDPVERSPVLDFIKVPIDFRR